MVDIIIDLRKEKDNFPFKVERYRDTRSREYWYGIRIEEGHGTAVFVTPEQAVKLQDELNKRLNGLTVA